MQYGFYTVCAASPAVKIAQCKENALSCCQCVKEAKDNGAELVVLSELCITGYTLGDIFRQTSLLRSAKEGLLYLCEKTGEMDITVIAGLPISYGNALYNTAAIMRGGHIIALVPKTYIPNYGEFYEKRHFASAFTLKGDEEVQVGGESVPFGYTIVQDREREEVAIGVEICEDLWTPIPPSTMLAMKGATVIANLSCSNEVVGKAEYRRLLVKGQSSRIVASYVYADAGRGESTTDMVFSAHNLIAQNGTILSEVKPFSLYKRGDKEDKQCAMAIASIDVERLMQERRYMTTYADCAAFHSTKTALPVRIIKENLLTLENKKEKEESTSFHLSPTPYPLLTAHPFIPDEKSSFIENKDSKTKEREEGESEKRSIRERCNEVLTMQAEGLIQRIRSIYLSSKPYRKPVAVVGLSGGLDSTLSLLVCCKAFDALKIDKKGIIAVTMPCFGTTSRTLNNAKALALEEGASLRTIEIKKSVLQHLKDVGLKEDDRSIAFENAQARERTQVLMDIANKEGGIVIGTGDLSELSLGWCTYNGDQMSMYGVNSSIPKTLVRHLVSYFADEAEEEGKKEVSLTLRDILDTPVSPELLPPDSNGMPQSTESAIGPYEVHDFLLYYTVRFGFSPRKILFLAEEAGLPYKRNEIVKWMKVFYRRFFSQQFKRSAMPDGAKVGTVSLSPRGDWRMPSDASAKEWLEEIDTLIAPSAIDTKC